MSGDRLDMLRQKYLSTIKFLEKATIMKEKFGYSSIVIIVMLVVLVAAGCQSGRADSVNLLMQPDSPTMVSFPLMAASQIYDFTADAQLPVQVSLVPMTRDLAYTAELRDEKGSVMATVSSSAIQNAVLTVGPGIQHYQVAIKSDNTNLQGILSMQVARTNSVNTTTAAIKAGVQSPIVVPYQPVAFAADNVDVPCSASSSTGLNINLRNGPGMNFGVVSALVNGTALSVSGKSNNGWYQVIDNGQILWVSESVTTLAGNCKNLLDVTPISVNNGTVQLTIADNGWGSVNDTIESVVGSSDDLIMITAPTLNANEPYSEFTVTLLCSGNGSDSVRWGATEKPMLKCGGSVVLPMTANYRQQVITVSLPLSTAYNRVQYTLMASRRV